MLSYIYKKWRRLLLLLIFVPEVIPRYLKGKDEVMIPMPFFLIAH